MVLMWARVKMVKDLEHIFMPRGTRRGFPKVQPKISKPLLLFFFFFEEIKTSTCTNDNEKKKKKAI
jgi:hypothetical protein